MLLEAPPAKDIADEDGLAAGRHARGQLDLDLIETWDGFEALREDWDDLIGSSSKPAHVFQQHSWIWHWWRTFLTDSQQPLILTARRGGRLVLVGPLVLESKFGVRTLSFMGDPVSQYSDVVCDTASVETGEVLSALRFATARYNADLLVARRVREDAVIANLLADEAGKVTAEQLAPALEIGRLRDIEEIEVRFSGKMRRNRRRLRKRLHAAGNVSFKLIGEGPEALEAIEAALSLKAGWLKHNAIVSNAFANDRFGAFWRSIASVPDHSVGLVAAVLEIDERPAAVEIGLRHKNVHCAHIGAFDVDLEKCSLGTAQMDALFEACIADGIECYDMLAPDDSYKRRIADRFIAVRDFVLPLSTLGCACGLLRLTESREIAKQAVAGLPQGLRRLLKSAFRV